MKVSVATITYGRAELLDEAIESFQRQDFWLKHGVCDKEMVVLNTYSRQHLVFDHPQVRVINAYARPKTLGETRNRCIEHCAGEFILPLDDDDIIRPNYISWLVGHIEGRDWIRQTQRFSFRRGKITGIHEQATNQTMFRRSVWEKVGGYPHENSGEDKGFQAKLVAHGNGGRVSCSDLDTGFIYRFGAGAYSVSKFGRDKPSQLTGLEHAARALVKAVPKRGKIKLRPKWLMDYDKLAVDWIKAHK